MEISKYIEYNDTRIIFDNQIIKLEKNYIFGNKDYPTYIVKNNQTTIKFTDMFSDRKLLKRLFDNNQTLNVGIVKFKNTKNEEAYVLKALPLNNDWEKACSIKMETKTNSKVFIELINKCGYNIEYNAYRISNITKINE